MTESRFAASGREGAVRDRQDHSIVDDGSAVGSGILLKSSNSVESGGQVWLATSRCSDFAPASILPAAIGRITAAR